MSDRLLTAAITLAYGPFVLMVLLYAAGLVLRLLGRPGFLATLVERTEMQKPIKRTEADEEP